MAAFDFPVEELRRYRPELVVAEDFESFWQDTVAQARQHEPVISIEKIDNRLALVDTYDLTFAGFAGQPIRAWLHVPAGTTQPLPTVVLYHGYSGGRGFPFSHTLYAQAGYAQLTMDSRGQNYGGNGWATTPDVLAEGQLASQWPGLMTRGILDPATYYYRRLYTDALRMLDVAAALEQCDASKIIVAGGSQGGGLAIAAAGLAGLTNTPLTGASPDVPFLCHFQRALAITDANPYSEIVSYLAGFRDHKEAVMHTLSYFDGANLSRSAQVPTLFSVALRDITCPPSTVFAAFNWWGAGRVDQSDKKIEIYEFNNHEGGGDFQRQRFLDWAREQLAS